MELHSSSGTRYVPRTPRIASPDPVRALPLFFLASLFQICNSKPRRGPKPGSPVGGTNSTGLVRPWEEFLGSLWANPPLVTELIWSVELAGFEVGPAWL